MTLKPGKCMLLLGAFCGMFGAAGIMAQTTVVPPSTERTASPYDVNPACRDRSVASTDPACMIQDGPSVRQFALDPNSTKPRPVAPAQENVSPPVIIVVPPQAGTAPK